MTTPPYRDYLLPDDDVATTTKQSPPVPLSPQQPRNMKSTTNFNKQQAPPSPSFDDGDDDEYDDDQYDTNPTTGRMGVPLTQQQQQSEQQQQHDDGVVNPRIKKKTTNGSDGDGENKKKKKSSTKKRQSKREKERAKRRQQREQIYNHKDRDPETGGGGGGIGGGQQEPPVDTTSNNNKKSFLHTTAHLPSTSQCKKYLLFFLMFLVMFLCMLGLQKLMEHFFFGKESDNSDLEDYLLRNYNTTFPLLKHEIDSVCSFGAIDVDDAAACKNVCVPVYHECCDPFNEYLLYENYQPGYDEYDDEDEEDDDDEYPGGLDETDFDNRLNNTNPTYTPTLYPTTADGGTSTAGGTAPTSAVAGSNDGSSSSSSSSNTNVTPGTGGTTTTPPVDSTPGTPTTTTNGIEETSNRSNTNNENSMNTTTTTTTLAPIMEDQLGDFVFNMNELIGEVSGYVKEAEEILGGEVKYDDSGNTTTMPVPTTSPTSQPTTYTHTPTSWEGRSQDIDAQRHLQQQQHERKMIKKQQKRERKKQQRKLREMMDIKIPTTVAPVYWDEHQQEWDEMMKRKENMTCTLDNELLGCVRYSKCHAIHPKFPPARSNLHELCTLDMIKSDPVACMDLCSVASCCYSYGSDNCLAKHFDMCMDYADCQNLRTLVSDEITVVPVANRTLDHDCYYETMNCIDSCAVAECCSNRNSLCYQQNFVSCLSYAPCNNITKTHIHVPRQFNYIEPTTNELLNKCNVTLSLSTIKMNPNDKPCSEICSKSASCCWDPDPNKNCFMMDPLGCLAWEAQCQVLLEYPNM